MLRCSVEASPWREIRDLLHTTNRTARSVRRGRKRSRIHGVPVDAIRWRRRTIALPEDPMPLFLSNDNDEEPRQRGFGSGGESGARAVAWPRIFKVGILAAAVAAIVVAVLSVENPLALFANAKASLIGSSADQSGAAQPAQPHSPHLPCNWPAPHRRHKSCHHLSTSGRRCRAAKVADARRYRSRPQGRPSKPEPDGSRSATCRAPPPVQTAAVRQQSSSQRSSSRQPSSRQRSRLQPSFNRRRSLRRRDASMPTNSRRC